jgi:hypothetical protein
MKKISNDELKNYLLVILSIAFIIGAPMLYLEKVEDKRHYERFLNRFYHELDTTLYAVENVLSSSETEEHLLESLMRLEKRFERTYLVLDAGNSFLNDDINKQTRLFMHRINLNVIEDGKFQENERYELKRIKEALEFIKNGLYSEETGQEGKNISIKEFNEILEEGARIGNY